jgi:outer membrane receptor protein involved in Fe transport
MPRMPHLRKLPILVGGLFVASSAFATPLQGEVRDSQGQIIKNTAVWLLSKTGTWMATVRTDANGVANFGDIAAGHYIVEIQSSQATAIRKEIDISGNTVYTVKMVMDTPLIVSAPTAPAATTAPKQVAAAPIKATPPAASTVTQVAAADKTAAVTTTADPDVAKIQITGARLKNERAELSPKIGTTVYTVDSRMIDSLGQGNDTPFNEVLLHLPGVDQDSKASGSLHVRDDHGNVQYRIDGVQLPESITGFGQSIDTRFIQQLDFVTGALPAQYGLRTAGIVDVQTKEGDVDPGGRIGILVGNHSYYEPSGEFWGSEGKFSYYLSGSFLSNSLGIENPVPTGNAIHDQTSQSKTFGSLAYFLDDNTRLGLLFGTYSGHFEIPDNPSQTPQYTLGNLSNASTGYSFLPSSQLNETQAEVNRFMVLSMQKSLGDLTLQGSYFHQYSNLHFTPDTLGDLIYLGTSSDTMRSNTANGVQFDAGYKLNATNTVRAGVGYTRQNTISDNIVGVFPTTGAAVGTTPEFITDDSGKTGTIESFYLQDEWHVSKPLTVNYGVRFDHVDAFVTEEQWSPRLNVAYKFSDSTSLHAGYSRYFTPPPQELASQSSINLYNNTTNAPQVANSDPVRAERTNYFDVGLSQNINSKLTVTADAYYKKITNLIDEGQFGQALILSPFNYQMGYAKGIELSGIYNDKNWGAYLNVTREKAQGENIVSGQALFGPDELAYISNHYIFLDHDQALSISGGVHYKFADSTQISSDVIYGSGLRNTPPGGAPNSTELPGYSTVNGALTHTWKKTPIGTIEGRLALINIFDKSYLLRDGTGVGVGAPQYGASRTLYAGISTSF